MECQSPAPSARRRSDRVSIAFPIEVAGTDLSGKRFSERTRTAVVSRYGCSLMLHRLLRADQPIFLRRQGIDEAAVGRVVAPLGEQPEGHVYGIGTRDSCEKLWGIASPHRFMTSCSITCRTVSTW